MDWLRTVWWDAAAPLRSISLKQRRGAPPPLQRNRGVVVRRCVSLRSIECRCAALSRCGHLVSGVFLALSACLFVCFLLVRWSAFPLVSCLCVGLAPGFLALPLLLSHSTFCSSPDRLILLPIKSLFMFPTRTRPTDRPPPLAAAWLLRRAPCFCSGRPADRLLVRPLARLPVCSLAR